MASTLIPPQPTRRQICRRHLVVGRNRFRQTNPFSDLNPKTVQGVSHPKTDPFRPRCCYARSSRGSNTAPWSDVIPASA